MGRRKKKSVFGDAFFALLLVVFAISTAIPKIIWIFVGCLIVIAFPVYLYRKYKKPKSSVALTDKKSPANSAVRKVAQSSQPSWFVEDDTPVSVSTAPLSSSSYSIFRIPSSPKGFGVATWIPRG